MKFLGTLEAEDIFYIAPQETAECLGELILEKFIINLIFFAHF